MIKASSGLSDEEVDRMIKDAEAHADEDRKLTELVHARNHADGMIHATEKSLKEFADQVDVEEKASIESGIEALREAIKGDDKEEIEAKTTALTELAGKLAERAYAQKAGTEGSDVQHAENASSSHAADDAVDAEFEEVKKD